ncbi:hypothetical protein Cri9333_0735 [Crinalium epipsammum PCC 9333]|uniref:Uncharacterized protein n=1 Tax=Crinalium epipsammum PCC 9333 TaxID=1173022 RepID=K9VUN7_9CYAN|nr:hypothetical protein Cri9333_0735 [Crinalium epipsammum PCC 9333]
MPPSEFEQFRLWFLDLDYERWDKQIEQDIEPTFRTSCAYYFHQRIGPK